MIHQLRFMFTGKKVYAWYGFQYVQCDVEPQLVNIDVCVCSLCFHLNPLG